MAHIRMTDKVFKLIKAASGSGTPGGVLSAINSLIALSSGPTANGTSSDVVCTALMTISPARLREAVLEGEDTVARDEAFTALTLLAENKNMAAFRALRYCGVFCSTVAWRRKCALAFFDVYTKLKPLARNCHGTN